MNNSVPSGISPDIHSDGLSLSPDINQLSVVIGAVMLVYALFPFIQSPGTEYAIQLPGVYLVFNLSTATVASFLVAALAGSGMYWLLQRHPFTIEIGQKANLFQHSLLPALTAWAIGVPLQILEIGLQWWAIFVFGGVLLVLVILAEYIAVDISNARHVPASIALTSVSFALFLILAVAIRAASLRLYLVLPALAITIFLLSLRTIYLRTGKWSLTWSLVIALIIGQLITAMHYWPLTPLKFGLIMLGPAYALSSMAGAIVEGQEWSKVWLEPVLMLIALWLLAFIINM